MEVALVVAIVLIINAGFQTLRRDTIDFCSLIFLGPASIRW